jgi:hypothetical protein
MCIDILQYSGQSFATEAVLVRRQFRRKDAMSLCQVERGYVTQAFDEESSLWISADSFNLDAFQHMAQNGVEAPARIPTNSTGRLVNGSGNTVSIVSGAMLRVSIVSQPSQRRASTGPAETMKLVPGPA